MRKVALVFALAVIGPSLVLAWLAVRSLRDQQFLLERQQSLLYQGVADASAKEVQDALAEYQRVFSGHVTALLAVHDATEIASGFDDLLRQRWPLAQVGFVVSAKGDILSPSPYGRPDARMFCADNSRFLANRESVEVYWNPKQTLNTSLNTAQQAFPTPDSNVENTKRYSSSKAPQPRSVFPQKQTANLQQPQAIEEQQQLSKVAAAEAEFRQLIGEDTEGALARFVDNKLNLLFWCRPPQAPQLVFGAQIDLRRLKQELQPLLERVEPALKGEIGMALLDDMARPAAQSPPGFHALWKRPFVATEIGEALPHWEIGLYLLNPAKLSQSARTLKLTLGLLITVLVLAIGVGSWLIVADLNRQLTLARQKTDFVSNVSHELKTPLTSIRMFSELLAQGRVTDPAKQASYLGIITAESARLTRLINNVLDFARMERGEKKYRFQKCDLVGLVRETAETYRPHLEAAGFQFACRLPDAPVLINGDRDALAQVIVNLLSNAEKYSDTRKEIELELEARTVPLSHAALSVLDRGTGVPKGSEEKIFEKFYRAHDALDSGVQGSGLGLTLARQVARAHGGDIAYEPRPDGGSCFVVRVPLSPT